MNPPILRLALIFLLPLSVRAARAPGEEKPIAFDLTAGLDRSYWGINHRSSCQTCSGDIVDYETEGLNVVRMDGSARLWGHEVLSFHHERPATSSERQKEILQLNKARAAGTEKYGLDLTLDALAARWFPEPRPLHRVLRILGSLKVTAARELFWGNATARRDATFLPIGTAVDHGNLPVPDSNPVPAGARLSFRTVFSSREATLGVFRFGWKDNAVPDTNVRAGYFDARWERLSDAEIPPLTSRPVIYEARFKARGIVIGVEQMDAGSPGFNFDGRLKWGVKNELETAFDWKRLYGEDIRVEMNMIEAGAWYNYYVDEENRRGFFLTAGLGLDLRGTKINLGQSAFGNSIANENSDLIYRIHLTSGYRF